ncbi:MAG: nucleotidyltransferase domain-containing protein [Bacteroidetes bacterium]|nr:nucleotidyltransferase domain-containing protein [Bacteroidota bacterium]
MDKKDAIRIAQRYIKTISRKYQIENVLLFGSFASGKNHPDSDIDLAIVFKSVDDIIDLQIELMQMRSDDDLLIEPHPFKVTDFDVSNPIVAEIIRNGIEIMKYTA